jgi:hypothetical protein
VLGGIGLWSVMGGDDDEPPRDVAPTEQTQPAERPARVAERDDPVRPPERPSLAPDPVDVDDTPVDPQGGAGSDDVVPDDADEDPPAGDDGAQPAAVQDDATEDDAGGGGDDAASPSADEDAAPPTTTGDVRKPPAGTPPEHADALSRLPVAPDDRAPVGGVGKSGVHVDRISLGPVYEKGECTGGSDTVSVEERKRFNVCLRVVHPREKEEVIVLWQKDGGTVRRGKVAIPASHAYRTRAYLLLRDEYVGKWTVRVMSDDGTELASHAFTVVE